MGGFADLCVLGYIVGPAIGFLPQIYKQEPAYNPALCWLTILSHLLKLFSSGSVKTDKAFKYQFCMVILVHCYIIWLHSRKKGDEKFNLFGIAISQRIFYRHLLETLFMIMITLKLLEFIGLDFLFAPCSTGINIFVTFLHLEFYRKNKAKPVELFVSWIVGDFIRLFCMLKLFESPLLYIFEVLAQIAINLVILLL